MASLLLQMSGQAALGGHLFRLLLTAIWLGMLIQYAVELWLLSSGRRAALRRTIRENPITGGEGGGPPVGARNRLVFAWPFLLIGFGIIIYVMWSH